MLPCFPLCRMTSGCCLSNWLGLPPIRVQTGKVPLGYTQPQKQEAGREGDRERKEKRERERERSADTGLTVLLRHFFMVSEKCSWWRETVHLLSAVEKHGASQCTYRDFGSFTDQGSGISDPPTPVSRPSPTLPSDSPERRRQKTCRSLPSEYCSFTWRERTYQIQDGQQLCSLSRCAGCLTHFWFGRERRREERWEELVLPWIRIRGELVLIAGARLLGWSWVSSPPVLLQSFVLSAPWKWDLGNINSLIELLTSLMPFFSTCVDLMCNYWIIVVSSRWIRADAEGHSCSSGCSAVQAVSPLVRLPLSIHREILTLKYENRKV